MNTETRSPPRATELLEAKTTELIIACAIEVHRELGPGLLESIYESALKIELKARRIPFAAQVCLPILYKGKPMQGDLRLDLLVDDTVIVEVKAVSKLEPVHAAQLLSYLRMSNKAVGLLLNFNESALLKGIKRVVNTKTPHGSALSASPRSSFGN